jgi:hypothetical protein
MAGKKRVKSASPSAARSYTGELAKPAKPCMLAHVLDPARPLPGFKGTREEWARQVAGLREYREVRMEHLLCELAHHYDVPVAALAGGGLTGGWRSLALALAMDHVPAFQVWRLLESPSEACPNGRPLKLGVADTLTLLLAAGTLAQAERDAGREEPDDTWLGRRIVRDNKQWAKDRKLTPDTIRKLLPQIRDAWAAVVDGRANRFQWQCVEEVLPVLIRGARS